MMAQLTTYPGNKIRRIIGDHSSWLFYLLVNARPCRCRSDSVRLEGLVYAVCDIFTSLLSNSINTLLVYKSEGPPAYGYSTVCQVSSR